MKIEISEKDIIKNLNNVLPSIIEELLEGTDVVENIILKNIEPTIKKLIESGELDKSLKKELNRYINDEWDSSNISQLLIKRLDDRLVFKGD